jgi:hypothetical protein
MSDNQVGVAKILRPGALFDRVYQGKNHLNPIPMPGTKDPLAGTDGYRSNLISALPVPMGSRLIVWFPIITVTSLLGSLRTTTKYGYQILWRLRNLSDFSRDRRPYHFPKSSKDVSGYVTIPGATFNTVSLGDLTEYEYTQPDGLVTSATQEVVTRYAQISPQAVAVASTNQSDDLFRIYLDNGEVAVFQQGAQGGGILVSWNAVEMTAQGDEMLVLLNRSPYPTSGNWDFTTQPDISVLDAFNSSDAFGVYVFTATGATGQLTTQKSVEALTSP